MAAQPWDFDYRLDIDGVTELARACGLTGDATYFDEGWDYATFFCDADARMAPWWTDLVGLWMWGGEPALESACAAYGQAPSEAAFTELFRRGIRAAIVECDYEVLADPEGWRDRVKPYLERLVSTC